MQQARQSEEHPRETLGIKPGAGQEGTEQLYLRNAWYVAGWASEFQASRPAGRTIIDEPVVLYRTNNGKLVALEDRCAHRWAPLSFGRVEGDDLRCRYHGLKFAADGRCVEVPGQDRIGKSLCVRAYPVVEQYRFAWVWMGDASLADSSLIPDLSMLEQSWRRLYSGSLDYEANYSLINDNLLDLSHLAFLHEKTLGRIDTVLAESQSKPLALCAPEAQPLERGVRTEGWLPNLLQRSVVIPKKVADGDFWQRTDFLVPGIFIQNWQMYPKGAAEGFKGLPPGGQAMPVSDGMSIQAVTPLTARKTRYFYSFGPRACDMEEEESNAVWEVVKEAFSEDLHMIQAQQKIMDTHPGRRMGGIAADRGLALFRNLMKRMIAGEAPSIK